MSKWTSSSITCDIVIFGEITLSHVSRSHDIKWNILYGCSVLLSMRTGITRNQPWTLCSGQPSSLTCPRVLEEKGDQCGTLARNRYKMVSVENHSAERTVSEKNIYLFILPHVLISPIIKSELDRSIDWSLTRLRTPLEPDPPACSGVDATLAN